MSKGGIIVDTKQLDRLTIELKGFEKQVGEAAYHALNRTIDYVITQVGRIVPKEYVIKAKDVKESFKGGIKRPTKNDLTASITSKGHTLSIAHFPHSPQAPPAKRRNYKVKATIKKGSRQTIKSEPKTFIASTGAKTSDKIQYNVFRRLGEDRLPITVIRTLSVPQMIGNEKVSEEIRKAAEDKFNERLEHEIIRAMTTVQKSIKKG